MIGILEPAFLAMPKMEPFYYFTNKQEINLYFRGLKISLIQLIIKDYEAHRDQYLVQIAESFLSKPLLHAWMLNVKGIHTRSPNTNMKPNLSAIMSHL